MWPERVGGSAVRAAVVGVGGGPKQPKQPRSHCSRRPLPVTPPGLVTDTSCCLWPNWRPGQQQPTCSSLIHDVPFFPTALWPLLFGRESFGLGRREPLPHGRSCQRPPVPDPPEDVNKAEEVS